MSAPATRLRVALDLAHLRQGSAGVARYARGLFDALSARDDVEPLPLRDGTLLRRGSAAQRAAVLGDDLLWYPWLGRRSARRLGAAVYHCPLPRGPLTRGRPATAVTVHDLAVFRHPQTLSTWNRRYTRATLRSVTRAADRVLVPSHDTADNVERLLGVHADRLRVVPNGVDAGFFRPPAAPPPVDAPYVLFVGTPEPRKNLERLGRAMEIMWRAGRRERLVLAGAGGWGRGVALEGAVTLLGRVPDATLHTLYAHASCLAIPSLHEGFGLPALEAMAAGCPVVASNAGALPEVCGDAAQYVDPLDATSIAGGITDAIAHAATLRARGRHRAAEFTWAAAADRLAAVYRELA